MRASLMRNFDENNITAAVLERFQGAKSPRVREISEALVRHLHNFIREIEPTFEEWQAGIQILTNVGKKCSDTRQEFILLSDTLGASMLVDAINHRLPAGATETTVLGPFFVQNAPTMALGVDISPGMPGEALFVEGAVRAVGGAPLPGAMIDVWHSDKDGYYDVQHYDEGGATTMRARFRADEAGRFWFWTIVPSFYPIPDDGPVGDMLRAQGRHPYRPAHVHFMISAPGYETLVTHVFVDGDKYLDSDVVFGVKDSLIRKLERRAAGAPAGGRVIDHSYAVMAYDFVLAPAAKG
jgi:hydroxyquinol 1,2-dioxygenase